MRALALVALTGCELLFPLREPPPGDAPEDELARPQGILRVVEEPVTAGTESTIELSVVGHAGAQVTYQLDSEPGMFETEGGMLELTEEVAAGVGRATALLAWNPPQSCAPATVNASLGYDQTIDPANRTSLDVSVLQQFGETNLSAMTGTFEPEDLIAMPVQVDAEGCNLVKLSIAVLATDDTVGEIGLYDDTGPGPGNLLVRAELPPSNVSEEMVLEAEVSLRDPLPSGKYWVAVVTNGGLVLDAEGNGPALLVNMAGTTLPEPFPSSMMMNTTLRVGVTVAPP